MQRSTVRCAPCYVLRSVHPYPNRSEVLDQVQYCERIHRSDSVYLVRSYPFLGLWIRSHIPLLTVDCTPHVCFPASPTSAMFKRCSRTWGLPASLYGTRTSWL